MKPGPLRDEELTPQEFEIEKCLDKYDFGIWPEVAGLGLTGFVIWVMFAFALGSY